MKKKPGTFHLFVNYHVKKDDVDGDVYTVAYETYHVSGKAEDEEKLKACGCVCSGLLDQLGIEHDIEFVYKPVQDFQD